MPFVDIAQPQCSPAKRDTRAAASVMRMGSDQPQAGQALPDGKPKEDFHVELPE
jgi:hypothetical protein